MDIRDVPPPPPPAPSAASIAPESRNTGGYAVTCSLRCVFRYDFSSSTEVNFFYLTTRIREPGLFHQDKTDNSPGGNNPENQNEEECSHLHRHQCVLFFPQ
jgi:hypothetical protein